MNSKIIIIFFLVSFNIVHFLHGQDSLKHERTKAKFGFGINTGINLSKLDPFGSYQPWGNQKSFNPANRLSGLLGFQIYYQPKNWLRLCQEINIAGYGGQFRKNVGSVNTNQPNSYGGTTNSTQTIYNSDIYRLTYVEFPISAHIYLLPRSLIRPYIEVGLSYGKLMSATLYTTYPKSSGAKYSYTNDYNLDHVTEKYFFNYLIGAGIDFFSRGNYTLGLNVRYNNSITRVFKYDLGDNFYGDHSQTDTYDLVTHLHATRIVIQNIFNF